MRSPMLADHHKCRHIYQAIHYYLILSYTSELLSSVFASTTPDHLEFAKKLLSAGKYTDALPYFNQAVTSDPNNYQAYYKRATVFLALNESKSALDDLNKALELNKNFTSALSQRAGLHVKMGNLDLAHIDYKEILKHEPDNDDALIMSTRIDKLKREKTNISQEVLAGIEKHFEALINATNNISQHFIHHVTPTVNTSYSTDKGTKNYASSECAKVVETNPEAKKASYIINAMIDEYMLNPCKASIWFVIELCETIQATHIEIANYELFSSNLKEFSVYFSDTYPAVDWKLVGQFTATDTKTLQAFDLNQVGFGKFIRVELRSHYGNEHYCPISEVKIYGKSMVEDYVASDRPDDIEDSKSDNKSTRGQKRKTSAYRVYRVMMTSTRNSCGLTPIVRKEDLKNKGLTSSKQNDKPKIAQAPQTTQPPASKPPLKSSIFVDLSNKVRALENSLKKQREEMERRLNETEDKFEKVTKEMKTRLDKFIALVLAHLVWKVFMKFR